MLTGMFNEFGRDYFLLVFVASLGVLQIAGAYSRLYALLIFGRRFSVILGYAAVVLGFTLFFTSEPRNVPDTARGLDGNQQALLFSAAALSALITTLLCSSLRNWSTLGVDEPVRGIDALRRTSYLRLMMKGLDHHWKHLTESTRRSSSG